MTREYEKKYSMLLSSLMKTLQFVEKSTTTTSGLLGSKNRANKINNSYMMFQKYQSKPIEFRANGYDNVWYYGDLVHVTPNPHYKQDNTVPYIVSVHRNGCMLYVCARHKIQEDTIGMFIGFKDRLGNKIYSGDIVSKYRRNFIVKWNDKTAGYYLLDTLNDDNTLSFGDFADGICDGIVVGNIYDNLDLINKQ